MTEDEARTKWCPYSYTSCNRTEEFTRCIASDCMMWRKTDVYWGKDGTRVPLSEINKYRTPEDGGFETISEGYCGLGGKP